MCVYIICVHGYMHECTCVALCIYGTCVETGQPCCLVCPAMAYRAAVAAWLTHQLLSHFRTHSDSLSLYPSLLIHLLGHFTSLMGYQTDITEYEDNKRAQ